MGRWKFGGRRDYSFPHSRGRQGKGKRSTHTTLPSSSCTAGCKDLPQNGRGKRRDRHPRLVAPSRLSLRLLSLRLELEEGSRAVRNWGRRVIPSETGYEETLVDRAEDGRRAQDDQVLPRVPGSLGGNWVRVRPTSFPPVPALFCPGGAALGRAGCRPAGPAYLLHPEELVEVELHLLHQVKQLQVSALPAARRPRGRQQQQQQRRRERHEPEPEPAARRKPGQPAAGRRHRAGLGEVTRRAAPSAETRDAAGSAGYGNSACQSEAPAAAPESPAPRPVLAWGTGWAAGASTLRGPPPLTQAYKQLASQRRALRLHRVGEVSPRLSLSQALLPVTSRLLATAGQGAWPEVEKPAPQSWASAKCLSVAGALCEAVRVLTQIKRRGRL